MSMHSNCVDCGPQVHMSAVNKNKFSKTYLHFDIDQAQLQTLPLRRRCHHQCHNFWQASNSLQNQRQRSCSRKSQEADLPPLNCQVNIYIVSNPDKFCPEPKLAHVSGSHPRLASCRKRIVKPTKRQVNKVKNIKRPLIIGYNVFKTLRNAPSVHICSHVLGFEQVLSVQSWFLTSAHLCISGRLELSLHFCEFFLRWSPHSSANTHEDGLMLQINDIFIDVTCVDLLKNMATYSKCDATLDKNLQDALWYIVLINLVQNIRKSSMNNSGYRLVIIVVWMLQGIQNRQNVRA